MSVTLTTSIVVHNFDWPSLADTLNSLDAAIRKSIEAELVSACSVHIVNNAPDSVELCRCLSELELTILPEVVSSPSNVGYGAGHNLVLLASTSDYHLILNPDVKMPESILVSAIHYHQENPRAILLGPAGRDVYGDNCFLAKRHPSLLVLALRALPIPALRSLERVAEYECRDLQALDGPIQVPLISGCFMLGKTELLRSLNGFDDRYFLYFEDFDLCRRAKRLGEIVYLPSLSIEHLGGNTAAKGLRHIGLFLSSAFKYFNRWGWKLY